MSCRQGYIFASYLPLYYYAFPLFMHLFPFYFPFSCPCLSSLYIPSFYVFVLLFIPLSPFLLPLSIHYPFHAHTPVWKEKESLGDIQGWGSRSTCINRFAYFMTSWINFNLPNNKKCSLWCLDPNQNFISVSNFFFRIWIAKFFRSSPLDTYWQINYHLLDWFLVLVILIIQNPSFIKFL